MMVTQRLLIEASEEDGVRHWRVEIESDNTVRVFESVKQMLQAIFSSAETEDDGDA